MGVKTTHSAAGRMPVGRCGRKWDVGAQVLGFVYVAQWELTLGSELCLAEEEA